MKENRGHEVEKKVKRKAALNGKGKWEEKKHEIGKESEKKSDIKEEKKARIKAA